MLIDHLEFLSACRLVSSSHTQLSGTDRHGSQEPLAEQVHQSYWIQPQGLVKR